MFQADADDTDAFPRLAMGAVLTLGYKVGLSARVSPRGE